MSHTMNWAPHRVTLTFRGSVSGAELVEAVRRVSADERFDGLQFVIFDFIGITDHSVDRPEVAEEIGAINIGCLLTNPNIRVMIITLDERIRQLAGILSAPPFESTYPKHLFDSMAQANDWQKDQPLNHGQHHFRL